MTTWQPLGRRRQPDPLPGADRRALNIIERSFLVATRAGQLCTMNVAVGLTEVPSIDDINQRLTNLAKRQPMLTAHVTDPDVADPAWVFGTPPPPVETVTPDTFDDFLFTDLPVTGSPVRVGVTEDALIVLGSHVALDGLSIAGVLLELIAPGWTDTLTVQPAQHNDPTDHQLGEVTDRLSEQATAVTRIHGFGPLEPDSRPAAGITVVTAESTAQLQDRATEHHTTLYAVILEQVAHIITVHNWYHQHHLHDIMAALPIVVGVPVNLRDKGDATPGQRTIPYPIRCDSLDDIARQLLEMQDARHTGVLRALFTEVEQQWPRVPLWALTALQSTIFVSYFGDLSYLPDTVTTVLASTCATSPQNASILAYLFRGRLHLVTRYAAGVPETFQDSFQSFAALLSQD